MEYSTSELCDLYTDMVDVVEPIFSHFGALSAFSGALVTVKCFESNGLIKNVLQQDGQGQVLLIDGGGSIRRALIDAEIAELAASNNWAGIVCHGAVRDVDLIEEIEIGIMALVSIPVGADDDTYGEENIPVNFAGVSFLPQDMLYADSTGIVLSAEALELVEDDESEDE
ncbi:ribonuclease E activity regulator RraA [Saccharobesus litoralis]|uniref:Regulator of ribonuclease activity A n=1 Tax=Saccharobesus litoralis TaxID=2172099 RepID=A0A2S0VXM7_9ALTE|nr:ribonuclease E activity regulator RraA [Saccharobesus litoralis]AWB68977.1 ribonuclease E activity regulator RraA [Saccharobesus litoralis]